MKYLFSILVIGVGSLLPDHTFGDTHPLIDLRGFWVIDEAQSETFEEHLSKFGRRPGATIKYSVSGRSSGIRGRGPAPPPYKRSADERFAGIEQILRARALHIDGYGDVALTYDGKLTRFLAPNPAGRVFSSSGKELVGDEFGRSLSYWDETVLVVETTTAWGLELVERFRQTNEANSLVVSVSVGLPGRDAVEWVRVYDRSRN